MTVAAFDTLKLAQALRQSDFSPVQAEGAAEAIAAAIQSDLATKADLLLMKTELIGSIADAESRLKGSISETEAGSKISIAELEAKLRTSLADSEARLRASLADSEAKLRTAIAESKADILKWMVGTIGFQTVIILGAVIALAHITHP